MYSYIIYKDIGMIYMFLLILRDSNLLDKLKYIIKKLNHKNN